MRAKLFPLVALLSFYLSGIGFAQQTTVDWHNEASWHKPGQEAVGSASSAKLGIGIENIFNPDSSAYQAEMRVALTTSKAPSLFDWWAGYRMKEFVDAGLVADLTPIWEKHIAAGEYSKSLLSTFGFNGKFYALPKMMQYYPVMYNKGVFEKYSLKPPATWADLMSLCEKLKSLNIVPISLPMAPGSWTSMIWFGALMVGNDPQAYVDLMNGKIKYNDPKVVAVMKIWKDLIDRGYIAGYDYTLDSLATGFAKNEVAMTYLGDWWISIAKNDGFESLGVFMLPGITAKGKNTVIIEGRPVLIGAKSPHLNDALRLADYLMSVDGSRIMAQTLNINSPNSKAGYPGLPPLLTQLNAEVSKGKYTFYTRYWEATPPEIVTEVVELLVKFMRNTDSLNEVLDEATQVADNYWAQHQ